MINDQVVQITEVLNRSVQGRTLPFRCRGADGRQYYVKGRGAGRRSLIAEWLACNMAKEFGLPVAEFRVVEVPEALAQLGLPEFDELGVGYAFGSLISEHVIDLPFSYIDRVPAMLRRDIAVFDWWVKNGDRNLTANGGNVNLLWQVVQQELVVIDYNLAFDDTFDASDFLATHVFAQDWNDVYQDYIARPEYMQRMKGALLQFDRAYDQMPEDWLEAAPGVPALISPQQVKAVLESVDLEIFWNMP